MSNDVSLITVTYNSSEDLLEHWSSPLPEGVEWIVVDNNSSDDSAGVAEKLGAKVVRLPRNVGFSGANNVGSALSDSPCLIFVNPDVRVEGEEARALGRRAIELQALVAPQLINSDGTRQENGRALPFLYRKFLHFFGGASSQRTYEIFAEPGELVRASWVIGAAVAVPRFVFEKVGGWDSRFFIYYEDSDLCMRASAAGYPTLIDGSVRWEHAWARATRKSINLASWKFEWRSACTFYRRYPGLLLHPRILGKGMYQSGR